MELAKRIKDAIIRDVKVRIFEENFPRIIQCIDELSLEEIWQRPNENSNSVGNLILHLCGNIRQYIVSGVGKEKDVRKRSLEFSQRTPIVKEELKDLMQELLDDIEPILDHLNADEMVEKRVVQGFDMNVSSILIHVTEHLSYHVGQIAYYTKETKNMDLKFYGDLDLDVT